jgi:hypothetical protein
MGGLQQNPNPNTLKYLEEVYAAKFKAVERRKDLNKCFKTHGALYIQRGDQKTIGLTTALSVLEAYQRIIEAEYAEQSSRYRRMSLFVNPLHNKAAKRAAIQELLAHVRSGCATALSEKTLQAIDDRGSLLKKVVDSIGGVVNLKHIQREEIKADAPARDSRASPG